MLFCYFQLGKATRNSGRTTMVVASYFALLRFCPIAEAKKLIDGRALFGVVPASHVALPRDIPVAYLGIGRMAGQACARRWCRMHPSFKDEMWRTARPGLTRVVFISSSLSKGRTDRSILLRMVCWDAFPSRTAAFHA